MNRPQDNEYTSTYARYVDLVEGENVVEALERQRDDLNRRLGGLDDSRWDHRYAPEKWSVRQLVRHLADSERIFGYRTFTIARGDSFELPGFDENAYASVAKVEDIPAAALVGELDAIRQANILFLRHLDAASWERKGVANESPVTVRALAWILAGHAQHHSGILRERYGV